MAERRMFAKTVLCSDAFCKMPFAAQALYMQLALAADDDGFVCNPKNIQKMLDADEKMLRMLSRNGYIIRFKSGVVAITHWKLHNYIQKDRYRPTKYVTEKARLETSPDGVYTQKTVSVSGLDT